jgi:hypothetical protein
VTFGKLVAVAPETSRRPSLALCQNEIGDSTSQAPITFR